MVKRLIGSGKINQYQFKSVAKNANFSFLLTSFAD